MKTSHELELEYVLAEAEDVLNKKHSLEVNYSFFDCNNDYVKLSVIVDDDLNEKELTVFLDSDIEDVVDKFCHDILNERQVLLK